MNFFPGANRDKSLEGPRRKPRHASVFSTRSDTQAVPALHCIRMFKGTCSTCTFSKRALDMSVFKARAFAHLRTKVRCESLLFSQGQTPELTQKWAKFMNFFSFWPFLWFGLPGRLLTLVRFWHRFAPPLCPPPLPWRSLD